MSHREVRSTHVQLGKRNSSCHTGSSSCQMIGDDAIYKRGYYYYYYFFFFFTKLPLKVISSKEH